MKKDTRLILALDVTSREKALSLALQLKGYFNALKIGYPLILSAGLGIVTEMSHPGAELFMAPLAERMARLAADVGATGVVAPATRPERIRVIRSIIGERIIISPGVGAQGGSAGAALEAGADYLIVGRSIYEAKVPDVSARKLLDLLSSA
ncbi:MAG TPA: orotidine 5'-phosphate decarboxylase [Methanothrix sp.]|nr:orotidine 5'-phosphate decarboxylase [Methanothrix sp.]